MEWFGVVWCFVGSVMVGNRQRSGYVLQFVGSFALAWHYALRATPPDWAMVAMSVAYCLLHVRNNLNWRRLEAEDDGPVIVKYRAPRVYDPD
jgi:hypothetical protein